MPIVDIELVSDCEPEPGLAGRLADEIGRALGAAEGSTWVRLRVLGRHHYGESGGPVDDQTRPVFVSVMARRRPEGQALVDAVHAITAAVARITGHPPENVHLVFAPDGAGRVAFGGRLVEE